MSFRSIFLCLVLSVLFVVTAPAAPPSQPQQNAPAPSPTPAFAVPLAPLGFRPLSESQQLSEDQHFAVHFLDSDHLLIAFLKGGLLARRRDCPSTHQDRLATVIVYKLSTGTAERQAEWYLHDLQQFLWPLSSGRMVMRSGNKLYIVNASLEQKLLLDSPTPFDWVTVTPGGEQIIVETVIPNAAKDDDAKFEIRFLDPTTLTVQRTMRTRTRLHIEATGSGYGDLVKSAGSILWLVRFGPDERTRTYITRVKSPCAPELLYPSVNTILVGRCSRDARDQNVSVFTLSGKSLWRTKLPGRRYSSVLARSEDGTRFALGMVRRPNGWVLPTLDDNDPTKAAPTPWAQVVEVWDAATGKHITSLEPQPYILAGGNFALSPDGTIAAALRGDSIEVYALPALTAEDKAQYLAVKADAPGLVAPTSPEEEAADLRAALSDPDSKQAPERAPAPEPFKPELPSAAATPAESSQSTASPGAPSLTIRKTALAVVVDTTVTDSKNNPIEGLTKERFSLKEDGALQSVRFFDEHRSGQHPAEERPPVKRAVNMFSNIDHAPRVDSVTVILFDALNTPLDSQASAQRQLIEYIKSKPKDSRVAVFVLTSQLRMISGFSDNEDALLAALQDKKNKLRLAPMVRSSTSAQPLIDSIQMDFNARPDPSMESIANGLRRQQIDDQNSELETRVGMTLNAFEQLARYLAGIPGRKNLIWMSAAFPAQVFPNLTVRDSMTLTRDFTRQAKKTFDTLAATHVAVYPVDVRGSRSQTGYSAAEAGNPTVRTDFVSSGPTPHGSLGPGGAVSAVATAPGSIANQQLREQDLAATMAAEVATMEQVAQDTGGKAFINANAVKESLTSAVTQGAHYYTLSYTPNNPNYDGRFRKVHLEVPGAHYQLGYRKGYFADDPNSPVKRPEDLARDLGVAAMQHGSPESRQIAFVVRVLPVGVPRETQLTETRKKKTVTMTVKVQKYIVDYAVSARDLRFVQSADGKQHGVFNFMITAFDDDGQLIVKQGSTATSDVKPATYAEILNAGYRMRQELEVPVKAASIRLGVQDGITGKIGTIEIPFPVPVPPETPKPKRRALPPVEPD